MTVAVVVLCLTKVNFIRSNELIKLALDISSSQNEVISGNMNELGVLSYEEDEKESSEKVEVELNDVHDGRNRNIITEGQELIAVSTESQENLGSLETKRNVCDYCLVEYTERMLKCGCYLCVEHKDVVIEGRCPICKKEI